MESKKQTLVPVAKFYKNTSSYKNKGNYNLNLYGEDALFTHTASTGTRHILEEIIDPRQIIKGFKKDKFHILTSKQRRINEILTCMEQKYIKYDLFYNKTSNLIHKFKVTCNSRLCPHCTSRLKSKYRRELRASVQKFEHPRFMTISFKNQKSLSKEFLKQSAQQFNIMRKLLKRDGYSFGSYVNVLEVKLQKKGDIIYRSDKIGGRWIKSFLRIQEVDEWNIHYHILYDGDFIPWKTASETLRTVTHGESSYLTIEYVSNEEVANRHKALNYITKYISKINFKSDDENTIINYYRQTANIKFVKTYNVEKDKPKKEYQLLTDLLSMMFSSMDAYIEYYEIFSNMSFIGSSIYDPKLDFEENFFKYGQDKLILSVLQ